MRVAEIITEWKEAYLYHATSIPNAIRIWRTDYLKGSTTGSDGKVPFKGVSTTRNYNYALGYMKGTASDDTGGVIFWINQDLVKRDLGRRRLKGYDWFQANDPEGYRDEFEYRSEMHDTDRFETVITKGGLRPFRKYVSKIEIWLPKTFDYAPDAPNVPYANDPDRGKINIRPNEQVMNMYLSDPIDKQAWNAIIQDPRTDVKKDPGVPRIYQGAPIKPKVQYDSNHPMYDPAYRND